MRSAQGRKRPDLALVELHRGRRRESKNPIEPINNHGPSVDGPPVDNRARSGGLHGLPEISCASACGLNRKEQVPDIPIPGRPDSRMQSSEVGPGLGAGNGERPELGPPETNPQARLPGRCQGPRGSCGQWKDIGPGGTRSARGDHQQVKSLAPEVRKETLLEVQGCTATNAIEAALKEENLRDTTPARPRPPPSI